MKSTAHVVAFSLKVTFEEFVQRLEVKIALIRILGIEVKLACTRGLSKFC